MFTGVRARWAGNLPTGEAGAAVRRSTVSRGGRGRHSFLSETNFMSKKLHCGRMHSIDLITASQLLLSHADRCIY